MKHANKLAKSGARTDNSNCSRSSAPSSLSRSLPLSRSISLYPCLFSLSLALCVSLSLARFRARLALDWIKVEHTKPYHTIPSYHVISYHIIYRIISYHIMSYRDTTHSHTHTCTCTQHEGTLARTNTHAHSRGLHDIAVGLRGGRGLHRGLGELALVGIDLGGNGGQLLLDEVAQSEDLLHAALASLLEGLSPRWLDHLLCP